MTREWLYLGDPTTESIQSDYFETVHVCFIIQLFTEFCNQQLGQLNLIGRSHPPPLENRPAQLFL